MHGHGACVMLCEWSMCPVLVCLCACVLDMRARGSVRSCACVCVRVRVCVRGCLLLLASHCHVDRGAWRVRVERRARR